MFFVKIIVTFVTQGLLVYFPLLEFTQHDGRKKKKERFVCD